MLPTSRGATKVEGDLHVPRTSRSDAAAEALVSQDRVPAHWNAEHHTRPMAASSAAPSRSSVAGRPVAPATVPKTRTRLIPFCRSRRRGTSGRSYRPAERVRPVRRPGLSRTTELRRLGLRVLEPDASSATPRPQSPRFHEHPRRAPPERPWTLSSAQWTGREISTAHAVCRHGGKDRPRASNRPKTGVADSGS